MRIYIDFRGHKYSFMSLSLFSQLYFLPPRSSSPVLRSQMCLKSSQWRGTRDREREEKYWQVLKIN